MYDTPLISIVIPVYNLEEYIGNTLQTILNQSVKNFEVIIVDDGSDDGSLDVINSIGQKDSRIKVYCQKNCGQANARNNGVNRSKGKFITFVDGDDLLKKDYLKIMVTPMLDDASLDIVALPHQNASITNIPDLEIDNQVNDSSYMSANEYLIKALRYNNNLYNVSYDSKMYARKLLKDSKIPEGHYYEDLAGLPNLLKTAHKVLWINNKQYVYLNDRPSSTVNSISAKKAEDIVWALEYLKTTLDGCDEAIKNALQITIINNIYVAYEPLKCSSEYLKKIDSLLKGVSLKYILFEYTNVHISRKGLLLSILRRLMNFSKEKVST